MKTDHAVPEMRLAVVIPAFRAEAHIAKVLRDIPDCVAWIVVVDDCSPDNTAAVVAEAARWDPRIRLLRHPVNQGVGGAVLTGYREACRLGTDIVVKMDSDGQMDSRYLPALIDPIVRGQADYTKGNRYIHTRHLRSMPLVRRVGNLGLSFLTKLASGYWNIFDPTNGYTAIHAAVIPMLNEEAIAQAILFRKQHVVGAKPLAGRGPRRLHSGSLRHGNQPSLGDQDPSPVPPGLAQGLFSPSVAAILRARFQHPFAVSGGRADLSPGRGRLRRRSLVLVGETRGGRFHGHRDVGRPAGRLGRSIPDPGHGHGHSRPTHAMLAPQPRRRAGRRVDARPAAGRPGPLQRKRRSRHLCRSSAPHEAIASRNVLHRSPPTVQ